MNAIEYLNISVEEMTAEEVILTMPIRDEIKQPYGIVHGGMNALLAETAGSFGANIGLDNTKQVPVGLDLSLIHISEPTRRTPISYAVFCLKKKKKKKKDTTKYSDAHAIEDTH